jgi:hypothetical protein
MTYIDYICIAALALPMTMLTVAFTKDMGKIVAFMKELGS